MSFVARFGLPAWGSACIAAGVACAPALAADMPARMPVKASVAAPTYFSWTGFHVGVHGGYARDPATATFDPVAFVNAVAPSVSGGGTVLAGPGVIPLSVHPSGGFGGINFGYTWQMRSFVYGWEADASFGKIDAADTRPFIVTTVVGDVLSFTGNVRLYQKVDAFGTLRARFGWANDALLLFASAGLAWGNVNTTFEVKDIVILASGVGGAATAAVAAGAGASQSDLRVGYAVGTGFDWAFAPAWSLRAEYLFIDLGNGSALVIPGGTANSSFSMHLARLGLTFRVGAP